MNHTVERVIDARALLAEGPMWDASAQLLYWVDIERHQVHSFDPQSGAQQVFPIGQYVSAVVPRRAGDLLIAVQHGFATLDRTTGAVQMVADVETHIADNRFNDGKCDPAGRFWAGTYSLSGKRGAASVYCLDTDRQVRRMIPDVSVSNGMAWSLDHTTLYYIDTATQQVVAFDYDRASGAIANQRVVLRVPTVSGWPDGMTIDAEGMLWIAHWGGSRVTRWDPARGIALESIPIPATQVSSCCFGGPALDHLYITTARVGLSEQSLAAQPEAGGIFCVQPGVCGLPADAYAG